MDGILSLGRKVIATASSSSELEQQEMIHEQEMRARDQVKLREFGVQIDGNLQISRTPKTSRTTREDAWENFRQAILDGLNQLREATVGISTSAAKISLAAVIVLPIPAVLAVASCTVS
jgi:hypothetical protein